LSNLACPSFVCVVAEVLGTMPPQPPSSAASPAFVAFNE
jgi:hypothetical protein